MRWDLYLIATVHSGPLDRQDTIVSAPIDFNSLLWHAGYEVPFGYWSLKVEEVRDDDAILREVPHQWDWEEKRLYWFVPGKTSAYSKRRFKISFSSDPGPKPRKNNLTGRIVLTDMGSEVLFSRNTDELCRYRYRNVFKPFFFPVYGPDGNVVRDIVYDEEGHHFHHGIWVGYGSMDQNSTNLWCESDKISPRRGPTGRMVHESFEKFSFGWVYGVFRQRLAYQKPDGFVFAREWRTVRVSVPNPDSLILDFEIKLQEPQDTGPRNTMFSCRVAPSMRVVDASQGWNKKKPMNNPGRIDKGRAWADYSGPVGQGWNGVALFDHPDNPDFPQPIIARDYGLMNIERTYPADDIYRGSVVTYKYRAFVHNGNAEEAKVEEVWQDYAYPCLVEVGELRKHRK